MLKYLKLKKKRQLTQAIKESNESEFLSVNESKKAEMEEIVNEVIFFDHWAVIRGSGYESQDSIGPKYVY